MSRFFLKFSQILSQGYILPYFSGFSAFILFIVGNIGACLYFFVLPCSILLCDCFCVSDTVTYNAILINIILH